MWDPINNKLLFFITKRLQLRFKKNTAAATETNGLKESYGKWRRNPTFNSNLPTFPSLIGSFLGAVVVFCTGKIGYAKFVVCPTPMSKSVFIFTVKKCF